MDKYNLAEIGTGIIKNTEMYELYYYFKTRESAEAQEDAVDMIANLVIFNIVELKKEELLRPKDVLNLLSFMEDILEKEKTALPLLQLQTDLSDILYASSMDHIEAKAKALDEAFEAEAGAPSSLKKERKVLKRSVTKLRKKLRKFDATTVESILRMAAEERIGLLLNKYPPATDIRLQKSRYEHVIAPYFPDKEAAGIMEAILDQPEIAEYAYTKALSKLENEKTESVLNKELKKKYQKFLDIARNIAPPDELAEQLEKAAQASAKEEYCEKLRIDA